MKNSFARAVFSQSQSNALAFVAIAALAGHSGGAVIRVVPPEPIISANTPENRNEPFDVNDDGAVDFIIENDGFSVSFVPPVDNAVSSRIGELIGRHVESGAFIGATLDSPGEWLGGFQVSPTLRIGPDVHACSGGFCTGDFSALGAFLGLEFDIGGETHYGWARLQGDPFFVRLEVAGVGVRDGARPADHLRGDPRTRRRGACRTLAASLLALRRRR